MVDLEGARWIWIPSQRTLPNTFAVFETSFELPAHGARSATGWIGADSRYRLTVNGAWAQWGPAPCDPRALEVDPVDLGEMLVPGRNHLQVEVVYYGHAEGTWVAGKPGMIFVLDVQPDGVAGSDSAAFRITSDASWTCAPHPQRAPGRAKRWYLRALQEVVDLRPPVRTRLAAMELDNPPHQPPICSSYRDYLNESAVSDPAAFSVVPRSIGLMQTALLAGTPVESHALRWAEEPDHWFDFRMPRAFQAVPSGSPAANETGAVSVPAAADHESHAVTYDLRRQAIGWPVVDVIAPEGTIVEVITQEAHEPGGEPWLETHFWRWARFTCREGANRLECFDYDSVRWIQVHVRQNDAAVSIQAVSLRAREYPFPHDPAVAIAEPALDRLMRACVTTVRNSAQETIVDCMGRERQQYSGDVAHEAIAVMAAFGERDLIARYIRTWGQGQTPWGYYLDCWPASDRTTRIPQRLIGLTTWGPILDHSAQFLLDNYRYALLSGDTEPARVGFPSLVRLVDYFEAELDDEMGYDVEAFTVPSVWVDHDAYRLPRHTTCAFLLIVASALEFGFAPLAALVGQTASAHRGRVLAQRLVRIAQRRFWSSDYATYVVNLPWVEEEGEARFCDRSLALALLAGYCPGNDTRESERILVERPDAMGYSYVPNQYWRHRALARAGRITTLLDEYRDEWANMDSVLRNGTISEHWNPVPDSTAQYSHSGVVPLILLTTEIAGVRPVTPGYDDYVVEPRVGDLAGMDVTVRTPVGPVRVTVSASAQSDASRPNDAAVRAVTVTAAPAGRCTVVLPAGALEAGSVQGRTVSLAPGESLRYHEAPATRYADGPVAAGTLF